MPSLIYYRQFRADAGVRSGIELDGETVCQKFEVGPGESDPTLLWYIELRCEGRGVPSDPHEVRRWLIDHEEVIRSGFESCARDFEAGRDVEMYPLLWSKFPVAEAEGVQMTIACATNRRRWAASIPSLLGEVGLHWRERIEELEVVELAS